MTHSTTPMCGMGSGNARCRRPTGHRGSHVDDSGPAVVGWPTGPTGSGVAAAPGNPPPHAPDETGVIQVVMGPWARQDFEGWLSTRGLRLHQVPRFDIGGPPTYAIGPVRVDRAERTDSTGGDRD